MDEARTIVRVAEDQARLLLRFTQSGVPGTLPGVDVATRLHPAVQTFVQMEDGSPPPDDDGGPGHVHGVGLLVEGSGQGVEIAQDTGPGLFLPLVGPPMSDHGGTHGPDETGWPAAVPSLLAGALATRVHP